MRKDPVLTLRNRQQVRRVDLKLLRKITTTLLEEILGIESYELSIQLVSAAEVTSLNEKFLGHAGSTDVITFDYSDHCARESTAGRETHRSFNGQALQRCSLSGDIVVCVEEAVRQAEVFGTTWQAETVRYVVHGVLHLVGYDDARPPARRAMKRRESELVSELGRGFAFGRLHRPAKRQP